jgi:8-oxo-dGTP pyrophosphatase MutT (NUDIX family)
LTAKFKQFAALPYRMRDDDVEILLITTRKKHRWSVPKGWPIKHSTPQTTAKIEAYEEAGVRGDIGSKQIGRFTKRRRRKLQSVLCEVEICPLEVTRQQGDCRKSESEGGCGLLLGRLPSSSKNRCDER